MTGFADVVPSGLQGEGDPRESATESQPPVPIAAHTRHGWRVRLKGRGKRPPRAGGNVGGMAKPTGSTIG